MTYPRIIEHKVIPILFADNTIMLITRPNKINFMDLNIVFGQLNQWFKAKLLSFNFDKTYFIHFTKKVHVLLTHKLYEDKHICTAIETKFLGLFINDNLSWKTCMECIRPKLSSAC